MHWRALLASFALVVSAGAIHSPLEPVLYWDGSRPDPPKHPHFRAQEG